MRRFIKNPLVIEAVQIDNERARTLQEILREADAEFRAGRMRVEADGETGWKVVVETLEGPMTASHGWWLIRGIEGEWYPCKDSVFQATYSEVMEVAVSEAESE